jgi:hypothetical protein
LRKTNSYCLMWGVFLKSVSLPKQWSFLCFLSQVQKKTSLMKNCFKKHFHLFTWMLIHFYNRTLLSFLLSNTSLSFWHPITLTLLPFVELLLNPQNNNTHLNRLRNHT